jgi:NADPH:quinone reductase-like Zn-dependent oxidoreductase
MRFAPRALMDQNKGVYGVNVGHLWDESDRVAGWMERLLGLYAEGVVRPVVDCGFPLERAAEAHHFVQDRKNFGKVLLLP